MQSTEGKVRLNSIDGLKGMAICIIAFIWHYHNFSPQTGLPFSKLFTFVVPDLYQYGWLMVELFFMLSGFGLVYTYEDKIINKQYSFGQFLVKRLKKLYPLMVFTLLFITIEEWVYTLINNGSTFVYPNFDLYHFILNLFCMQNGIFGVEWSFNSPSWCISIILICYVAFYVCVSLMRRHNDSLTYIYLGIGLLFSASILLQIFTPILNLLVFRGLGCFFIGAFLCKGYQSKDNFKAKNVSNLLISLIIIIFVLTKIYGYNFWGNVQMVFILFLSPAIIWVSLNNKYVISLLSIKPLVYLGKCSYSIYLWHFPVQCAFGIADTYFNLNFNYSSHFAWLMYTSTVISISIISYRILEPILIRFLTKLLSKDN